MSFGSKRYLLGSGRTTLPKGEVSRYRTEPND